MPGKDRDDDDKGGGNDGAEREPRRISALEMAFSGLGLLLTLGMLAFIAWEALTRAGEVWPAVTVEAIDVRQEAGVWIVGFEAMNHAPATAANVEIEGTLREGGRTVGTGRATLDYVPGNSSVRGGMFFDIDPSGRELELRATGYSDP